MNYRYLFTLIFLVSLSACEGRHFFYSHDDENKSAGQEILGSSNAGGQNDIREPLDVPPELRGGVSLPSESAADQALDKEKVYASRVAGKAVALDARLYQHLSTSVFSAVVDAMTALNMPVQSVDSASGTITTDWIRRGADSPNFLTGLGFGSGEIITRHRFVVRIFPDGDKARLEIRTLAQGFINNHWVNRPLKRKVSEELFVAVEEQLERVAQNKLNAGK
ncbi:MAG: outer membrane protein assembly factor BamC [Mariprofundaceae bacterium]